MGEVGGVTGAAIGGISGALAGNPGSIPGLSGMQGISTVLGVAQNISRVASLAGAGAGGGGGAAALISVASQALGTVMKLPIITRV